MKFFFYSWIKVRILAEKVQDQPEHHDDRAKKVEFSLPTWLSTVFKCPTLKIRTRKHIFFYSTGTRKNFPCSNLLNIKNSGFV